MEPILVRNFVGDRWCGEPVRKRVNPARLEEIAVIAATAGEDLVDEAIERAALAQPKWAAMSAPTRGAVLLRAAEILEAQHSIVAADLTREEGKTLGEAGAEVARASSILRFFGSLGWQLGGETYPATNPDWLVYDRREPLGIVAAITPWNFPIAIPAWKLAPALVAGNAVILKPAGLTAATAAHLVRALVDAGLPPGVLALVLGSGSDVGDRIVDDRRVTAVTFTGSAAVGARVRERAARRQARVQLEMGGKNALVVLRDADPAAAAAIAASGAFGLTGQACTATSRVICEREIARPFLEALRAESTRFQPGDGSASGVLMGPVVSPDQLATNLAYVDLAKSAGLRVNGGEVAPDSLFMSPAVIEGADYRDRVAQEEIFGPVLSVLEVDELGEAIDVANATPYGLVAGMVTADLGAANRFVRAARAGIVKVNLPTTGAEPNVPFGGVDQSSSNTFREQGKAALDFFTWTKSVYVAPPPWDSTGGEL